MLFKNRSVVMKMIDDKEVHQHPPKEIDYDKISQEIVKTAGQIIIVYILADTLRQAALMVVKAGVAAKT
jgi:hypothetical protein